MAPNPSARSFIHALMAGSRSTAPLNRSNSVLIVAPLSSFEIYGSGGLLEFDLCRVPQRVKYTQQEIRRNVFRVVIHDGCNARPGSFRHSRHLGMRQALPPNHLDNLRVEMAPQFDFRSRRWSQPQRLRQIRRAARHDRSRFLHQLAPSVASYPIRFRVLESLDSFSQTRETPEFRALILCSKRRGNFRLGRGFAIPLRLARPCPWHVKEALSKFHLLKIEYRLAEFLPHVLRK